jgi:methionyl-tRNA formyltransferase
MKIAFMGSPEFATPSLQALAMKHEIVLVVTQPDKPAGRGGAMTPPMVKLAAKEFGLRPVIQPANAKDGELEAAIKASKADLSVVVAYGKILPPAVLTATKLGCLNVHGSLLPKYRGAAPVQWSVINGDTETGVSIMQLDEGMDTGPVWLKRSLAINPDETSGELLVRLSKLGAPALVEAISQIIAGTAVQKPQSATGASHARMLVKADGNIDFAQPAQQVAGRIRGVDPWPGAQVKLRNQTVKVFRARAVAGTGAAGTVLSIDAAGVRVACGQGAVVIRELQIPGRNRLAAAQVASGRGVAVGDVLSMPDATA